MRKIYMLFIVILLILFLPFKAVNAESNLSMVNNILDKVNFDKNRTIIAPFNNGDSIVLLGYDKDEYTFHLYELDALNNYNIIADIPIEDNIILNKVYFQNESIIFCASGANNTTNILKYENSELTNLYTGLISIEYFDGLHEFNGKLTALGTNNGEIERLIIENGECNVENIGDFASEVSIGVTSSRFVLSNNQGIPYYKLSLRDGKELLLESDGKNYVMSNSSNTEKSLGQLGEKIYGSSAGTLIVSGYDSNSYDNKQAYFYNGELKNMLGNIYVDSSNSEYTPLFPGETLSLASILNTNKDSTLVLITRKSKGNSLVLIDNKTGERIFEINKDDLPNLLKLKDDTLEYLDNQFFKFFVYNNKCYITTKEYNFSYYGEYDLNTKKSKELLLKKDGYKSTDSNEFNIGDSINLYLIFIPVIIIIFIIIIMFVFKKIFGEKHSIKYLIKHGKRGHAIVNSVITTDLYSIELLDYRDMKTGERYKLKEDNVLMVGQIIEVLYDPKRNIAIKYSTLKYNSSITKMD